MDYERSDELLQWELDQLDKCDPSMDLIVLPESSDVPAFAKTKADYFASTEKYTDKLLAKCKETAIRYDAVVFVNASYVTPTGPRNTTYAINRQGEEVGYYFKKHLVRSETVKTQLDSEYTFGNWEADKVLQIAACLEEHYFHSVANAVLKAAIDRGLDHEEMHTKLEYVVAHGIASLVDGEKSGHWEPSNSKIGNAVRQDASCWNVDKVRGSVYTCLHTKDCEGSI